MSIKDCSCKGINPECKRCDGKGYYETEVIIFNVAVDKSEVVPIKEKKKLVKPRKSTRK